MIYIQLSIFCAKQLFHAGGRYSTFRCCIKIRVGYLIMYLGRDKNCHNFLIELSTVLIGISGFERWIRVANVVADHDDL